MSSGIEQWIDSTLDIHRDNRISCSKLLSSLKGYFSPEFLEECFFVVLDELPKPNSHLMRQLGAENLLDGELDGITYKNTYFIKPRFKNNLRTHFHELIHVVQWKHLGAEAFITRYIREAKQYGGSYSKEFPLEKMAYSLEEQYVKGSGCFDVIKYVKNEI